MRNPAEKTSRHQNRRRILSESLRGAIHGLTEVRVVLLKKCSFQISAQHQVPDGGLTAVLLGPWVSGGCTLHRRFRVAVLDINNSEEARLTRSLFVCARGACGLSANYFFQVRRVKKAHESIFSGELYGHDFSWITWRKSFD